MLSYIIVGSGWPFGAEFLAENERTQLLTKTSRKLTGPAEVTLDVAELLSEADPQPGFECPLQSLEYSLCAPRSFADSISGADPPGGIACSDDRLSAA